MAYQNILLEIAEIQRKLLSYKLNLEERSYRDITAVQKSGLFGMKKRIPMAAYERRTLLEKLEEKKAMARAECPDGQKADGFFWWELPWEQTEEYLLYDLLEVQENQNWRFERTWERVGGENTFFLLLREEGHCSAFNGRCDLNFYETSAFSAEERTDMIRKYQKNLDQKEWEMILWNQGKAVYSPDSGRIYNSMEDYVLSAEHYFRRDFYETKYKESLTQQHQQNLTIIASNSIHYSAVFAAAGYKADDAGVLLDWSFFPYELIDYNSEVFLEDIIKQRQNRDSAVAGALFLAQQKEVTAVPVSLFGASFSGTTETELESVWLSEMLTCLSGKLQLTGIS